MFNHLLGLALIGLPLLLAAPIAIMDRWRPAAWAGWLLLVGLGSLHLFWAGTRFHNVNSTNQTVGSHLIWLSVAALFLAATRPIWNRGGSARLPLRAIACLALLAVLIGLFGKLPLLPTI